MMEEEGTIAVPADPSKLSIFSYTSPRRDTFLPADVFASSIGQADVFVL